MAEAAVAQSGGYTRQQFTVLVVLGAVNFLSALVYSIQAPFYPAEAEKKGATASVYGLVFGCYELTTFLICPIFGAYLHLVGPKFAFNLGVFVAGSSVIMFGFLDRFDDGHTFIILSFILRISEAIGSSAVFISIYTFVTIEFPGSVATTFGLIETIFGFGLCIGPAVGAALYSVGGSNAFTFPFVVLGGLLFLSALVTMCALPNLKSKPEDEKADDAEHRGLWKLLQLPEALLFAVGMIAGSMGNSFLSATLEPHLRQFKLSSTMYTGLVFLLYGGTQALATPLWGMVLDRGHGKFVTLAGSMLILTGYLLIGPAPFFNMKPILWVTCVGLAMFGNGLGAIFVSCFVLSLNAARKGGFPDNLRTYGIVSGLWRSTLALGAFAGPSLAGVLYDNYGFRNETMFIVGVQAIMVVLILGFITNDHFSRRGSYYSMMRPPNPRDLEAKSESTPLVQSAHPPPYDTYDRQESYNPHST